MFKENRPDKLTLSISDVYSSFLHNCKYEYIQKISYTPQNVRLSGLRARCESVKLIIAYFN